MTRGMDNRWVVPAKMAATSSTVSPAGAPTPILEGEDVPSPVISALVGRGREPGLREGWRERKGDRKRRPSPSPAFARNRPAMGADDPLNNGEPKPAAAAAACAPARRVGPVEALKEVRQVFRPDADPRIPHQEKRLILLCLTAHGPPPAATGVHTPA